MKAAEIYRKNVERLEKELEKARYNLQQSLSTDINWSRLPVDTLINYTDPRDGESKIGHFAKYDTENRCLYVFDHGASSHTSTSETLIIKTFELNGNQPWVFDFNGFKTNPVPDCIIIDTFLMCGRKGFKKESHLFSWGLDQSGASICAYRIIGIGQL